MRAARHFPPLRISSTQAGDGPPALGRHGRRLHPYQSRAWLRSRDADGCLPRRESGLGCVLRRAAALTFAEEVLAALLTALCLFLLVGEMATPFILRVIAPGFAADPAKFALAVELTRIMFPYLVYISLVSFLGGMLNSVERFAATAATPALLNLFLIAALVFVRPASGQALAWAVTASGLAQFLWLTASCQRAGLSLSLPRP